jgi:hypothetical protein
MGLSVHVRKDGQYWSDSNRWTPRLTGASNFRTTAEAEKFCRSSKLTDAEIVVLRPGKPPMSFPVGRRV